jgi:hypothetical protein
MKICLEPVWNQICWYACSNCQRQGFFLFSFLALLPLSQTGCATCLSMLSEELLLLLGILFPDCEGSEFLSPMLLQQPTTGSISLTSRECSPEEPPLWNVHFLFVFVMVYDIHLWSLSMAIEPFSWFQRFSAVWVVVVVAICKWLFWWILESHNQNTLVAAPY